MFNFGFHSTPAWELPESPVRRIGSTVAALVRQVPPRDRLDLLLLRLKGVRVSQHPLEGLLLEPVRGGQFHPSVPRG